MSDEVLSAERIAYQATTHECGWAEHHINALVESKVAEALAQAQASLAAARAQALEEAENVFKDEYSKHDSPLIGVTRGLKAVRALPSDSTALAKLLAEERLDEAGWWNRLLTPKEFREHRAEIDRHYAELGAARVAELKGEQP